MSVISDDLPDPLTPDTATKVPSGNETSMFFRLFAFAPLITSFLPLPARRLVEDVEDAHQLGADLGREPDALRLTARQGVGRPIDGEVLEAHVDHELQPLADLLEDAARDDLLPLRASKAGEEVDRRVH